MFQKLIYLLSLTLLLSGCSNTTVNSSEQDSNEEPTPIVDDNESVIAISETNDADESEIENESDDDTIFLEVPTDEIMKSYEIIFDQYRTAINESYSADTLLTNHLSPLIADTVDIGYAFIDFDQDGSYELIFGDMNNLSNGEIYDMYAFGEDSILHILSSTNNDKYYVARTESLAKRIVRHYEENEGTFQKFLYIFDGQELVVDEALRYNENGFPVWTNGYEFDGELYFDEAGIDEKIATDILRSLEDIIITPELTSLNLES